MLVSQVGGALFPVTHLFGGLANPEGSHRLRIGSGVLSEDQHPPFLVSEKNPNLITKTKKPPWYQT
jgi:hypothetical protein